MTPTQKRIINAFQELTQVRTVYPSFRKVAKRARCSPSLAHKVITLYRAQNKAFGVEDGR